MSEEYEYLVDRYSSSLTKYDVLELFRRLEEKKGNKTTATKEADIQRKTVWDWVHNTKDIKEATKRKVLQASLKTDLYGTIDFLVRKNATDYNEILQRCIYMIFENMISLNEASEFQRRISQFEEYLRSNAGAISDIKTIPIEEMIDSVNQKASSLGVEEIAKDINFISPQRLSQKIMHLLEVFSTKSMFKHEIADKLGLPKEFVERACKAFDYMNPSTKSGEESMFVEDIAFVGIGVGRLVDERVGQQFPARAREKPSYYHSRKK